MRSIAGKFFWEAELLTSTYESIFGKSILNRISLGGQAGGEVQETWEKGEGEGPRGVTIL